MQRPGETEGQACANVSQALPVVFVVDDDVSVRESLELLIRSAGWQPQVFGAAQQFLAHPRVCGPSCLLLDVSLPDLHGLDLQRRIVAERADMPIIFITGYPDVPVTVRAMKAGAIEFFTKPFNGEALLDAIRDGIERSREAIDTQSESRVLEARYAALTPREREVMTLVVRGLLNKQVAAELGISEITVKGHRGRLMEKMEAGSLPELVIMAAKVCPQAPAAWQPGGTRARGRLAAAVASARL
ncbi:response regulator transcription factor [Paraburkholderia sp. J10-1]|uniref:response regulator transcription factor n=1 Tax=Paraburkholderia sp. J10-1 TaxID=2805430 RepID=UPI002AB71B0D|nr:response regulator [Paraburkholderia sp. J10-1]